MGVLTPESERVERSRLGGVAAKMQRIDSADLTPESERVEDINCLLRFVFFIFPSP